MLKQVVILALFGLDQITAQDLKRSAHGRDSEGKFKNHQTYLQMVNELNTAESTHETMFEGIKERLKDPEFIETAMKAGSELETDNSSDIIIQDFGMSDMEATSYLKRYPDVQSIKGLNNIVGAKEHWAQTGSKEGRTKTEDTDLTPEETDSYMDRYPDVKTKFSKLEAAEQLKGVNEHWKTEGMKQNRNPKAADRITKQQAFCYLKRYPDLQKAFGMSSTSWIKAQAHYYEFGYKEKRDYKCDVDPVKCAGEGETCSCPNGFLYFGKRDTDFQTSMQYHTIYRDSALIGGKIDCNGGLLGDPLPGVHKQCWCEPWDKIPPFYIAMEGNTKILSECPTGTPVYFGAYKEGTTVLDFDRMVKYGKYIKKTDQNAETECTSASFGSDPTPGVLKQCMCDKYSYYNTTQYNQDKSVWELKEKKEEEEKTARMQLEKVKQAQEEAERIRIQSIEDAKKAEAEKKRKLEMSKSTWFRAQEEALAKEKAKREQWQASSLINLNAAQKKEMSAENARFKAAKAKRMYERAKKAKKRANAIDKVKLAIEVHNRKIQMQSLLEAAELKKIQALELKAKNELNEEEHEKIIAAQAIQAQINAVQEKNADAIRAATEAARAKAIAAANDKKAADEESEAKNTAVAVQKNVQQAIDDLQKKQQEKEEREKEEQRIAREKKEKERADRLKAWNDKQEKQQEEFAEKMKAAEEARKEAIAEAANKLQREQQAQVERQRIQDEEFAQKKDEQEAASAAAAAQAKANLAKDKEAQEEAAAEQIKANEAVALALERKAKIEAEKKELEEQQAKDNERIRIAEEKAEAAEAAQQKAKKQAESDKEEAAAAEARSEAEQKAAEAEAQAETDRIQAEYEANQKRRQEAALAQKVAQDAANDAAQEAHHKAEDARKAQEDRQAANLAKKMEKRQSQFKEKYEHVWMTGPTGISMIQCHVPDSTTSDWVLEGLFYDNLIADAEIIYRQNLQRSYLVDGKVVFESGDHELLMTTSDERLQEAVDFIIKRQPNMKIDIMVTAPATGNINYIEWVKRQTVVPEFEKKKQLALALANSSTDSTPEEKPETVVVNKNSISAAGNTQATASFIKM